MRDEVFIIGGGPSLGEVDLRAFNKLDTIAVNKSAFFIHHPTYFITMDYSFIKKVGKARLRQVDATKFFVLNRSVPYLKAVRGAMTDVRFNLIYEDLWDHFDNIIISKLHEGIGTQFNDFRHGGCSGYCALQLAILLGYKKIYLLGIDLNVQKGRTHFHSGYGQDKEFPNKLDRYLHDFQLAAYEASIKVDGLQLISCSPVSRLNGTIPYKPLVEVLRGIKK